MKTEVQYVNSKRNRITVTPERITLKINNETTNSDDLELLLKFQKLLAEEDIDVGNSFRGSIDYNYRYSKIITATLYNDSRKCRLTISMAENKLTYRFSDK